MAYQFHKKAVEAEPPQTCFDAKAAYIKHNDSFDEEPPTVMSRNALKGEYGFGEANGARGLLDLRFFCLHLAAAAPFPGDVKGERGDHD